MFYDLTLLRTMKTECITKLPISLKNCVDKRRLIDMSQMSIKLTLEKNVYFLVDGVDVKYTLLDNLINLDTRKLTYVADDMIYPNIDIKFGEMTLVGDTITIDENIKNEYRNLVKEIETKKGRNLVIERIEKIQNEIEKILKIKLIVENIINNLNDNVIQDKILNLKKGAHHTPHTYDNHAFFKEENTRSKKHGIMLNSFSDDIHIDKYINRLNENGIQIVNIDKNLCNNEQIMNKFRNELYTKLMLSNIYTNICTYINWLKMSIDQVQKDTFYLSKKYFCYDVIENRIMKLPQNFDNILHCFDDVFSFRDYNESSFCKEVNNENFIYKIANGLLLCKSNKDGKWNIFPSSYEEIGDIENIEKNNIIKIIDYIKELKYCGKITTENL